LNGPHPALAGKGWPFVAASLIGERCESAWRSFPVRGSALSACRFFRALPRPVPQGERIVMSPADSRAMSIKPVTGSCLNRLALKTGLCMNVFNVYSNRSPLDCEVMRCRYSSGQRGGFIRSGSRVGLCLRPETRTRGVIGEKVSATSTVLAELP
jgi:phosphatidylserine decarboxylase